jgi:anti-sigma B factor antagonist
MKVSVTNYGEAEVIHMPEKLTMANATEIKNDLNSMLEEGHHRLVLDMAGVNFTDSSGLAVLVALYKGITSVKGRAVLLSPQPSVQSLLELTRLQELFEIFQDPSAAIERVKTA